MYIIIYRESTIHEERAYFKLFSTQHAANKCGEDLDFPFFRIVHIVSVVETSVKLGAI